MAALKALLNAALATISPKGHFGIYCSIKKKELDKIKCKIFTNFLFGWVFPVAVVAGRSVTLWMEC